MEDKEILCPQEIYEKYLLIIDGIRFTPREIDIIACIMHGKNAKGIANFLSTKDKSLETKTIESHILNIKRKIAANSREGIISFIEKSDKYKLIHSYYSSLLIQQEFNKILQEILTLTKSDKLSFLIVLPRLGKDNLNLLVNKLCIDLRLIGITVSTEFQENPNATPIVVCLKHKEISATGIQLKQCTIYVLAVNEANVPDHQEAHSSIIVDDDKEISKVFFLLAKEQQRVKILSQQTSQTNVEYINLSQDKQYHFLFLEIITRLSPNTNIENIIHKFKERYSSIIENSSSIYPIPPPVNKDIQDKTKNIYILAVSVVSILVFVIFGSCFFIFKPNINKIISSQGEESQSLTAQKPIISTKNLITWNIPRQDHIFIGRKNLLDDFYNKLHHHNTPQTISSLAISVCSGLGGIGKTQLALQYINNTKYPYTLKAWFPAENVDHLYNKYVEFAKLLGYAETNYTREGIIAYVKQWLTEHPGWLLIYDNVNNYHEIAPFLPKAGGYVILTTRQRHWPTNFSILPIDVMTEAESMKTLNTLIQRDITKEESSVKKLVEMLGYLPLALVQAGAYIKQNNITIQQYLELYKSHETELLVDNTFLKETNNYNYPVAITWNISLEAIVREAKLNNEPPIAIELLTVCAYLAPDKISRKLLLEWLQAAYPHLSSPQLTLNKHIALLWQYSMINYTDSDHIAIHRLVQTVLRYQLQQGLDNKNNIYSILDLRWFELLLQFFIDHEHDFKLTNSFQQLIETSKQFKSKFKDNYNTNLATMDLIISSAYFHQEKYQDFFNILQEVDRYLQKTDGLELLKCKILYLYSAYFCKAGNYQKAEEKINEAISRYNHIKTNKSIRSNDLKNLKATLWLNKASISLVKNDTINNTNIDKLEVEKAIQLMQEAISLLKNTGNTRNFLRSIVLQGKLFILTKQFDKVIIEFNKYNNFVEEIANDRTKIRFYLIYSDAYLGNKDFDNALNYCHKAKQQAEKLHLKNELDNINNKEKIIKALLQKN